MILIGYMRVLSLAGTVLCGSVVFAQSASDESRARDEVVRFQLAPPDGTVQQRLKDTRTEPPPWQVLPPPLEHGRLGLAISPAGPALSHQLRLPPGVGLVVEQVFAGSPAEKAGVQQYDLLEKLDEQLLVNPQQLVTLLAMRKPGEQLKLSVIRQGEKLELMVTLSAAWQKKPLVRFEAAPESPRPTLPPRIRTNRPVQPVDPPGTSAEPNRGITILLDNRDGHSHMVARDASGKILFDGPVDEPGKRSALAPDVREAYERLMKLSEPREQDTFRPKEVKPPRAPQTDDDADEK